MNEDLKNLLKANFTYILLVIVVFAGGIYFLWQNSNKINLAQDKASLAEKQETLENLQRELDVFKESVEKKQKEAEEANKNKPEQLEKPIFKTILKSEDSFSTNAPLFEDIIKILKSHRLKLVSIENKTTGFEDPIVQNGGATYNTCMVDMQILGSYVQFQKFLTHLYDYPYLINIAKIDAIPYDKDKQMLIVKLSIILYSETTQEHEGPKQLKKD